MSLARLLGWIAALALVLSVLIAVLANAVLGDEVPLSGWIALGAGAFLTMLVGSGLFALLFYSARRGYDDIDRHEDESSV